VPSVAALSLRFVQSASDVGQLPDAEREVALVGRSNVGKSSLLNALAGSASLARTSKTPGATRLINVFELSGSPGRWLVDLPGYGYAKVSKAEREKWLPFVDQYLSQRGSLRAVVLLVDPRRDIGLDETEIVKYVAERGVFVIAVMTKADKLSKHERKPAMEKIKKVLGLPVIAVSATDGDGLDELWRRLLVAINRGAD
jgi:GTP-binding protein